MPHQCTSCDHVFADGSKEMLSGCPDCGGNTFQYLPADADAVPDESPPERPGPDSSVAQTVGRAATTLRDAVTSAAPTGTGPDEPGAPESPEAGTSGDAPESPAAGSSSAPATPEADEAAAVDADPGATPETDGESATTAEAAVDEDAPDETVEAGSTQDPESASLPEFVDDPRRDAEIIDDSSEDVAQSSARTDLVTSDELPDGMAGFGYAPEERDVDGLESSDVEVDASSADATTTASDAGTTQDSAETEPTARNASDQAAEEEAPAAATTDLSDLREELNDQFEGIRIHEKGQYELNLMELYEREETIIALKENGRYVIEPPESWRGEE